MAVLRTKQPLCLPFPSELVTWDAAQSEFGKSKACRLTSTVEVLRGHEVSCSVLFVRRLTLRSPAKLLDCALALTLRFASLTSTSGGSLFSGCLGEPGGSLRSPCSSTVLPTERSSPWVSLRTSVCT
ncbi:hypothetical protein M758_2G190400 [Ceratodon purpureus]|nr:hypothetical protein M758_2G190400 [Ceratodon purpureus]